MEKSGHATGAVDYADDGDDLLPRIAVGVLDNGGAVVPVRADDVQADDWSWNGTAIARLRYPLAG